MRAIRSKRELAEARKILRDLLGQLAALRKLYRHDAESLQRASRGLRQLARDTRRAIAAYGQAQGGRLPAVLHARNPDSGQLEVARVLRLLRLAARLGQNELAERLGTRQASISRWERDGYDRYNLRQLQHIAQVLGYDLDVAFIRHRDEGGST